MDRERARGLGSLTRVLIAAAGVALACAAGALVTPVPTAHGEPSCGEAPLQGSKDIDSAFGAATDVCRQANQVATGREHDEEEFWDQVAGAAYPETAVSEESDTPFEADLYTVRFRNKDQGFAGGAICAGEVQPEEVEECPRVPVIYGTDGTDWTESYRSEEPGYVGAIAWIKRGFALAVGGTGTYPRRESNPPGAEWDFQSRRQHDRASGAGDARAWVYQEGTWTEISEELPEEMTGLTALDIWIGRESDGDEWGLAGDYGHIWEWEGGEFTGERLDSDSPGIGAEDPEWAVVDGPTDYTCDGTDRNTGECTGWTPSAERSNPGLFVYRVREIRIAPDRAAKRAIAITAGCCGPDANGDGVSDEGTSRRLEYRAQSKKDEAGVIPPDAPARSARPRWIVPDTANHGDSAYTFAYKPGRHGNITSSPSDEYGEPQPAHNTRTWAIGSVVVAPGGAKRPVESQPGTAIPGATPLPPQRYVAADGDTEPSLQNTNFQSVIGDGVPDWLAGEAPSPVEGESGMGLLRTTVRNRKPEYGGVRPHCNPPLNEVTLGTPPPDAPVIIVAISPNYVSEARYCRLDQVQSGQIPGLDEDGPIRNRESGIQEGPSWALNSIDMLDSENAGYAVGDRGAILRFSEPPPEPDPPSLGKPRPEELPDASPYQPQEEGLSQEVGSVPSLDTQPRDETDEPQLVAAGSPDGNQLNPDQPVQDVGTIVMSRDGSEGWGIGPSPEARGNYAFTDSFNTGGMTTLYHYRGGRWTRCDPIGIEGIIEPDPACEDIADIYRRDNPDGTGSRVRIRVAARVPLEYDDDPSNDDEFEVLAVGDALEKTSEGFNSRYIPTVVRYREGRWRLEPYEVRRELNSYIAPNGGDAGTQILAVNSLACAGPDECWLSGTQGAGAFALRRWTGSHWVDCSKFPGQADGAPLHNRGPCGDSGDRVGTMRVVSLTSAADRTYITGYRTIQNRNSVAGVQPPPNQFTNSFPVGETPVILYKDQGAGEQWQAADGGFDPGVENPSAPVGRIIAAGVARRDDGRFEGWAVATENTLGASKWPLLRLDPETGEWSYHKVEDAAYDTIGITLLTRAEGITPQRMVALPGSGTEPGRAYISTRRNPDDSTPGEMLAFNPTRERWELAERPGLAATSYIVSNDASAPAAVTTDGRGGVWAVFNSLNEANVRSGDSEPYFYNYTRQVPREIFEETDNPLADREDLTDLAGSADGSIWLSTEEGQIYRRDRVTGWDRVVVKGWDPGRVVTRRSAVSSIALGPDGTGVAVGERGRIADLTPEAVVLDAAAGRLCDDAAEGPCGTSFDLMAAAVAPGGAAMVGGEGLALLARDPGGHFQRVTPPDASPAATVTGISMPVAGNAWIALDSGQLYAGEGSGASWRWRLENQVTVNDLEHLLTEDPRGEPIALRDVSVDAAGRGFAVGDRGLILERKPWADGESPWLRVKSGVTERLTSVALPAGGGAGAIAGGEDGLMLTFTEGEWRTARVGDQLRPMDGDVAGVALLPGYEDGQVEAWGGVVPPPPGGYTTNRLNMSQLLHYSNDPSEPLLDPNRGTEPLADVPAARPGELSFAAFGRSDCHFVEQGNLFPCPALGNSSDIEPLVLRRIRDELLARAEEPAGPDFAIFTGDAYETASNAGVEPVEQNNKLAGGVVHGAPGAPGLIVVKETGGEKYRRLNEQVTDWLPDHGLPLFAPIGARDLSESRACFTTSVSIHCAENRDRGRAGENLVWRQAMEHAPAPWGAGDPAEGQGLLFEPIADSENAVRQHDLETEDPDGETGVADPVRLPGGGASTHYAADIVRDGERVARLVVADTSTGSVTSSDPIQQPLEPDGQTGWLERMLCVKGSATDTGACTREPGQQAIVVSNTPTYSYGPTAPTETQVDASLLESTLLRHRASVVVSGRLGWNGRYWALAPGLHEPCPGQAYVPDHNAPQAGSPPVCGNELSAGDTGPGQLVTDAQKQAGELLGGTGGVGALPFVVASGAGGRFDEFASNAGQTTADQGFWRGYTIVRLDASGDTRETVVEQRPLLDWIGITGGAHVLRPNKTLTLKARGREPVGSVPAGGIGGGRFDEITTAAITHRFELLEADPNRPWVPQQDQGSADDFTELRSPASERLGEEDPCGPYLCLDPKVGRIDDQSGAVKAGKGNYPRTFAVAQLSVGGLAATHSLVFEPRSSFRPPRPHPPAPPDFPTPPSEPTPPPEPIPPVVDALVPPALPTITPPEVVTPPEPPIPPDVASEAPIDLTIAPTALLAPPPTAVAQPPTPAVNPAPPSGASREARQRQAAAQKSGADAVDDQNEDAQELGGDLAEGRPGPDQAMTRNDFTSLSRRDQPSAWARDALIGGGFGLAALILALGLRTARPTPRRREPELPAPAWARGRSRRH